MWYADSAEIRTRVNLYSINGTPDGRTDGQNIGFGEGAVAQRLAISSPMTITLNGTYNSSNRTGTVSAHLVNTSTGTVSGTLQFVITENGIHRTYGNDTLYNNVCRKFLPNQNGQSISIPVSGTLDTSRTFTLGSSWVSDSCCIVVFVQSSTANEILQAAKLYIPPTRSFLAFRADSVRDSVGNLNGYLQPGETGNYFVSIVNMNPPTATGVSATIASSDTFIQILTSSATYPNITGYGASQFNTTPFVVRVKPTCPYGRWVPVTMTITAGTMPYTVTRTYRMGVGAPNDYIGPDTYGYYTYENLDTRFTQSPPYSWVEIDPQRGGPGTLLSDVMYDDTTKTRVLPFRMKLYGDTSHTISICSNGWLALGTSHLIVNQPDELPTTNGAPDMIAGYWCDLDASSATGGGRISGYSDAANHRYIVEFDSVQIYSGNHTGRPQTFQYIIRDPAYYPTPTGDGEIIIQYQQLVGAVFGAIGIQNKAMTVGTDYYFPKANPATYGPANGRAFKFSTSTPTSGVELSQVKVPGLPFALYGVWPNPSRSGTTISFSLPAKGQARLAVYNVAGQLVRTLTDGVHPAGRQSISWDGKDTSSRPVPGGIYFYRLSFGDRTLTQKTLILR